jgi:hypothetical protein
MKPMQAQVINSRNLRLAKPIKLKNGERIEIMINRSPAPKMSEGPKGLFSRLKKIQVRAPRDFAKNIDEHIYGSPRS